MAQHPCRDQGASPSLFQGGQKEPRAPGVCLVPYLHHPSQGWGHAPPWNAGQEERGFHAHVEKHGPSSQVEGKAETSAELVQVQLQVCGAWQIPRSESETSLHGPDMVGVGRKRLQE